MFEWLTRLFRRKPKPEAVVQLPKSIADSFAYDKALLEMYPCIKIDATLGGRNHDFDGDALNQLEIKPAASTDKPFYQKKLDEMTGPPGKRPMLIIGEDQVLAKHLFTSARHGDDGSSLLGTVAAVELIVSLASDPTPTYDPPASSDDFTGGGGDFAGGGADGSW